MQIKHIFKKTTTHNINIRRHLVLSHRVNSSTQLCNCVCTQKCNAQKRAHLGQTCELNALRMGMKAKGCCV